MKKCLVRRIWRAGYSTGEYAGWTRFLERAQWWDEEMLRKYQWACLKRMISYCYTHIPYYRNVLKERKIVPEDIRSMDMLSLLPFLTKEIIRDQWRAFFPRGKSERDYDIITTGGSTGSPIQMYRDFRHRARERAYVHHCWKRAGFYPRARCAVLRGEILPPGEIFSRRGRSNTWVFSSYHVNERTIAAYAQALKEINPEFLHVYPSSLELLVKSARETGADIAITPRAILSSSEKLSAAQRDLFERFFSCRVFSHYGNSEEVAFASECERSTNLHISGTYSYVELIPPEAEGTVSETGLKEIVGTHLVCRGIPLLRYRTGDLAACDSTRSECCGRHDIILREVAGREQELLVLDGHHAVPLTGLIFGQHFEAFERIKKFQIEQKTPASIIVRLIPTKEFSLADQQEIMTKIKTGTRQDLMIKFEIVNDILPTQTGKHPFFIQRIPTGGGNE